MIEENVKERKIRNTLLLIIFSLLFFLANCFVAEMSENKKNYHAELRKDIDGLKTEYGAKVADLEIRIAELEKRMWPGTEKEGNNDSK